MPIAASSFGITGLDNDRRLIVAQFEGTTREARQLVHVEAGTDGREVEHRTIGAIEAAENLGAAFTGLGPPGGPAPLRKRPPLQARVDSLTQLVEVRQRIVGGTAGRDVPLAEMFDRVHVSVHGPRAAALLKLCSPAVLLRGAGGVSRSMLAKWLTASAVMSGKKANPLCSQTSRT